MKRANFLIFGVILFFITTSSTSFGQCPEITDALLSSPDCYNGSTPCDVCPGDVITLSAEGDFLPDNGCIDWYYSTTPGFNPYNGEGTLIGCGAIDAPPPAPCSTCPEILLIWIDACGSESANEFMIISSGSGFNVNNFGMDFDPNNNNLPPSTDDVNMNGGACNWQVPSAGVMASVESAASCDGSNVIAAGPGTNIPAGAIVVIFTSSAATTTYDFEAYCAAGETIYVMQNSCARTAGAFSNNSSSGLRTTTIELNNCNCSHDITHDTDDPSLLGDGDYAYYDNGNVEYGNGGCGSPAPPYVEPPTIVFPPSTVDEVTFNITSALCNGGPYYIVGIVDPLANNCPEIFTEEFSFNVLCPEAEASINGTPCIGSTISLIGSGGDTYTWTGPNGFASTEQNPVLGQLTSANAGTYFLTVTNESGCTDEAQIVLTIFPEVTVTLDPEMPQFCEGQSVVVTAQGQGGGGNFSFEWTTQQGMSSGPSVSINQAGTFSVTLTDGNGCTAIADGIATVSAELDVTILPNPAGFCVGDSVELNAIVAGGSGGEMYTWEDPAGNIFFGTSLFAKQAGLYTLIVTDQSGCTGSASVNVSTNPTPVVNISAIPALICAGSSTEITATASNGTGNYNFSWSTPTGPSNLNPIITTQTGTYIVTVTDDAGCQDVDSVLIGSAPPLVVTFNPDPATFCTGGTLLLTALVSGNQGNPLTYSWTTPTGTATGNPLNTGLAGNYSVTVSEENGCTGTASIDVTESQGLSIQILPPTASICEGGEIWLTGSANGGDGNYDYVWLDPTSPEFNDSLLVSEPGVYIFGAVDGNGCEGMDSIEITLEALINISIVTPQTGLCPGETIELILNPAPGGDWVFVWTTPSGATSSQYPLSINEPGIYSVNVVYGGGCTSEATLFISSNPQPQIEITPLNPSFCAGGNITLSVQLLSGGPITSYSWNGPSGNSSNADFNVSLAGNYSVTVTNDRGCSQTANTQVTISNGLNVNFINPTITICGGGETTLAPAVSGGVEPYTYIWNGPTGIFSGDNLITGTAGIYQVTVTDNNGCSGNGTVSVELSNNLTVSITPAAPGFCPGDSVDLIAESTTGQSPYIYMWVTPSGPGSDQTFNATLGGQYSVTLTDAEGCSGTSTIDVEAYMAPVIDVSPSVTSLCSGQTVNLIASATQGEAPYQFTWDGPNGVVFSEVYDNAGVGGYTLVVIDNNGCSSSFSQSISSVPGLSVEINVTAAVICGSTPYTATGIVSSGQSPYTYSWNTPEGTFNTETIDLTIAGMLVLEVTDQNGCSGIDTLIIGSAELGASVTTNPERCPGAGDGEIIIESLLQGSLPLAFSINGQVPVIVNQLPFVNSNLTGGTYLVGLTDPSGCEVVIPVFIDVANEPTIIFDPAEITIVRGESILLSPSYLFNPNEYLWSPAAGLSCDDCPAPIASPGESTIYSVIATDDSGCFAEAEVSILIKGNTRVYIPSAFSPNFDGINDLFYIQAADNNARVVQLQIFDRWGNSLFEAADSPVNDPDFGWDGSFRGKKMHSGVFVYTALIRFPDGFERLYRGEATIVY